VLPHRDGGRRGNADGALDGAGRRGGRHGEAAQGPARERADRPWALRDGEPIVA
jgi:hypothetical protein